MTMPRVATSDLLAQAVDDGTGLLAFNAISLEHAEGICLGAQRVGRPVIVQMSQNAARFHGSLAPISAALVALAEQSATPVALHLDHVEDDALLRQAAGCGYSSVMVDAGALPYGENVATTAAAAARAHVEGLLVEAELGFVGGKPDQVVSAHTAGVRTDPDEAAQFVAATGVDALAVAVGSSHKMETRTAVLDHELIARIAAATGVPLVLHGSSGVAPEELRRAIAAGMRKINVGTALNVAFTGAVRQALADDPVASESRRYLSKAREAVADAVADLLLAVG